MALEISVGQRFGRLTALRRVDNDSKGYRQWLCRCDCGRERPVTVRNLMRVKSCGCKRTGCRIVVVGQIFGHLTALRFSHRGGALRVPYFWFRCSCGNEKLLNGYRVAAGRTKSCGCIRSKHIHEMNALKRLPEGEGAVRALFVRYRCRSKDRKFEFVLSPEEFSALVKSPCAYCGKVRELSINKAHPKVRLNGLDRLDSSVGYLPENVVACCKLCNQAKNNMTVDAFKSWIREVAEHTLP